MQFRSLAARLAIVLAAAVACKTMTQGAESQPASSASPAAASAPDAKPAEGAKPAERKCLDCHGPFDKLIKKPAKYTAPSGEKINPHRYVPHDSTLAKDIPECIKCHKTHPPKPPKGSIDLSKVDVKWCYSCHHVENLKSCKECHP
jgi:hypothetical protein